MKKTTRITSLKTEPTAPATENYKCFRCGRESRSPRDFRVSQSRWNAGNRGKFPICVSCIDEMYDYYLDKLGNKRRAVERVCMRLDVYWSDEIFAKVPEYTTGKSVMQVYISESNKVPYTNKSYDDTLAEIHDRPIRAGNFEDPMLDEPEKEITKEMISFWGRGYKPEEYLEFEEKYAYWTNEENGFPCSTVNEQSVVKNIVLTEYRITKAVQSGDKVDQLISAYNNLMSSGAYKPSQQKENSIMNGGTTLGQLIQIWEENDPVPEEETTDWGLVRYITIWFLGHLCKMLNIHTPRTEPWMQMYEQELEKYRVQNPEDEDLDDEELFTKIIGLTGSEES